MWDLENPGEPGWLQWLKLAAAAEDLLGFFGHVYVIIDRFEEDLGRFCVQL